MTDCPKAKRRCTDSRSTESDPDAEPEGSWTVSQLKEFLRSHGGKQQGNRSKLLERYREKILSLTSF